MVLTPPHLFETQRWKNRRIGLFGGSFNPPHAGHYHVARTAQIKFGLDFVWWIITPQNPLKSHKGMAGYDVRYEAVEKMLRARLVHMPTHLERDLGTAYTYETVCQLKSTFPETDFLWICGMDNAYLFHKWDKWQELLHSLPITFIARPPANHLVQGCPLRQVMDIPHYRSTRYAGTDLKKPGIYWLAGTKMMDISSTKIRNNYQKNQ